MKQPYFYIETNQGMKFDTVTNGLTAMGDANSPAMVSFRADSSYFYDGAGKEYDRYFTLFRADIE